MKKLRQRMELETWIDEITDTQSCFSLGAENQPMWMKIDEGHRGSRNNRDTIGTSPSEMKKLMTHASQGASPWKEAGDWRVKAQGGRYDATEIAQISAMNTSYIHLEDRQTVRRREIRKENNSVTASSSA